jgi:hypothetical protein
LELRGNVPDQAIRSLAVHVAQKVSGMRVVDALTLNNRPMPTPTVQPPEMLQRQAMHVLGQNLGKKGSNVQVDVWNNGQVLLKGSVVTFQDKLAASRCLQKVAGCCCAINQLSVSNRETQAQMSIPDKANESPIKQVAFVQQENTEPSAKTAEVPAEKKQPYFTPQWRKWEDLPSKPAQPTLPATSATTAVAPKPAQPEAKPTWGLIEYLGTKKAPAKNEPQQTVVAKPEVAVAQVSARQPVIVPEVKAPEPVKNGTPGLMIIDAPKATLLTPTAIQQPATELAKMASAYQPQTAFKPVANKSPEPHVTSGVMIFENTPSEARPKAETPSAHGKLQEQIARVCGKPAQDVQVTNQGVKTLLIRVKASDESEGPKLSDLIFRIPELAPYEVSLDIAVVR